MAVAMIEKMPGCPFCAIADGSAPAKIRLDLGDVLIFDPLEPVTGGHVLVVPRQHVEAFNVDPAVTARVAEVAAEYARVWRDDFAGFNLITSDGAAATQTVMHLHFHVVPRHPRDRLALPWSENVNDLALAFYEGVTWEQLSPEQQQRFHRYASTFSDNAKWAQL